MQRNLWSNIRRKNGWNTKNGQEIIYSNLVYDFKGPTLYSIKKLWKNIKTSRKRAKIVLKRFKRNNIKRSEAQKWETVIYNKKS